MINITTGIKYNAEKEAAAQWEAKQKELLRIEEAKKAEAEKRLCFANEFPLPSSLFLLQ
jgi:hypothetical protein